VAGEIIRSLNILPFKPSLRYKLGEEKLLQFNISQAAQYYSGSQLHDIQT
jgi:DNA (cytosine-5)-methyltransferase 1